MTSRKRILLIEDRLDAGRAMAEQLGGSSFDVDRLEQGIGAASRASSGDYDLLIVLRGDSANGGLSLVKDLREKTGAEHSDLPVLVVAESDSSIDTILALEMGANDVVPRNADPGVLTARIRALFRRRDLSKGRQRPHGRLGVRGLEVDLTAHRVWCEGTEVTLSKSEFAVLKALISNAGKVLSRQVLIDLALGRGAAVTARAIDTHIFTLRGKLGRQGGLIQTVRGTGYRLDSE